MLVCRKVAIILTTVLSLFTVSASQTQTRQNQAIASGGKIAAPARGKLYHGIHIGGGDGEEDIIFTKPKSIDSYIDVVGKTHKPFFVYFSQEWGEEGREKPEFRKFPKKAVDEITKRGGIPFIRLMLRSSSDSLENCKTESCREQFFSLENIVGWNEDEIKSVDARRRAIHQEIDSAVEEWGNNARIYGKPLIIEFGTEINNHSFHWNAEHNLNDREKAAALVRRAYRYLVRKIEGDNTGNSNITWVFHVTADSDPVDSWNEMANYFPDGTTEDARNYVDWVGVSIYGATDLEEKTCEKFGSQFDRALDTNGLLALSKRGKERPIFILEFGTTTNFPEKGESQCQPEVWMKEAFAFMLDAAQRGRLAGFSWWSENFEDDSGKKHKLKMKVSEFDKRQKKIYADLVSNQNILHSNK